MPSPVGTFRTGSKGENMKRVRFMHRVRLVLASEEGRRRFAQVVKRFGKGEKGARNK